MEYLVTAEEMKRYDANTINVLGIPGMVLMERAALAALEIIEERFGAGRPEEKTVFILAGIGNNGGDGLALARMLCEAGYQVTIRYMGDAHKASQQWKLQKKILEHFPVSFCGENVETEYTIMVDALFGVGLSRNIEGEYAQAIAAFNDTKGFKLALDVPSGIHSDTGQVLGCAVSADVTVTFGFLKRGLIFYPGAEYAGEIRKAEIGISERSFLGNPPKLFCYTEKPLELLPQREKYGNKGTFGKVLLVAGSENMAGAAVLAARAAYRTGSGMVKVITAKENRVVLQTAVPECLFGTYEDLKQSMEWADVIAIGPGLGTTEEAKHCMERVLRHSSLPLVIDADGLNILAKEEGLLEELAQMGEGGREIILTPHMGELSRLMKLPIATLKERPVDHGCAFAEKLHAILVAKDARTFICVAKGEVCVNIRGNSGMATAGSGDVLTGILAGLLAQGMVAFEAAGVGVYLHALAGDYVAAQLGEPACMAGDIVQGIAGILKG